MAPIYAMRRTPTEERAGAPSQRARRTRRLGGTAVSDALLREARLGGTGELLLGRLGVARGLGVALALLDEAVLGSAGELLLRRHRGAAAAGRHGCRHRAAGRHAGGFLVRGGERRGRERQRESRRQRDELLHECLRIEVRGHATARQPAELDHTAFARGKVTQASTTAAAAAALTRR